MRFEEQTIHAGEVRMRLAEEFGRLLVNRMPGRYQVIDRPDEQRGQFWTLLAVYRVGKEGIHHDIELLRFCRPEGIASIIPHITGFFATNDELFDDLDELMDAGVLNVLEPLLVSKNAPAMLAIRAQFVNPDGALCQTLKEPVAITYFDEGLVSLDCMQSERHSFTIAVGGTDFTYLAPSEVGHLREIERQSTWGKN
jgi:hypothetical protein